MYDTQKGREIHGKATGGEWKADSFIVNAGDTRVLFGFGWSDETFANLEFSAAAHNDFPAIMDEMDALRAENAILQAENAALRARLDAAVWDLEGAIDRWALCDLCANSTQDGCLAEKEHGEGACNPKWRGPTAREGEV
jgi:hypothetical protein